MDKILNIATMLTAIVSIVVAVITYIRDTKRKAQQDTFEAYQRLQNDVLSKINRLTPSEVREFSTRSRSEEYKQMTEYLMTIECFCIGLKKRIYDFEVFYSLTQGYFNDKKRGSIRPTIEPMIEEKTKRFGRNFYPNLESIWNMMDQRDDGA